MRATVDKELALRVFDFIGGRAVGVSRGLAEHPKRGEIAKALGCTETAVAYALQYLRKTGRITTVEGNRWRPA